MLRKHFRAQSNAQYSTQHIMRPAGAVDGPLFSNSSSFSFLLSLVPRERGQLPRPLTISTPC